MRFLGPVGRTHMAEAQYSRAPVGTDVQHWLSPERSTHQYTSVPKRSTHQHPRHTHHSLVQLGACVQPSQGLRWLAAGGAGRPCRRTCAHRRRRTCADRRRSCRAGRVAAVRLRTRWCVCVSVCACVRVRVRAHAALCVTARLRARDVRSACNVLPQCVLDALSPVSMDSVYFRAGSHNSIWGARRIP